MNDLFVRYFLWATALFEGRLAYSLKSVIFFPEQRRSSGVGLTYFSEERYFFSELAGLQCKEMWGVSLW